MSRPQSPHLSIHENEDNIDSRTSSEEYIPPTGVGLNMMVCLIARALRYSQAFSYDSRTAEWRHSWLTGPSQWLTGGTACAGVAAFITMLLTTLSSTVELVLYGIFAVATTVSFILKREDIKHDYGPKAALFLSAHKGFQAYAARHRLLCFCKREIPYNFDLYLERATQEMAALESDAPRIMTSTANEITETSELNLPSHIQEELRNLRLAATEIARKSENFEAAYRESITDRFNLVPNLEDNSLPLNVISSRPPLCRHSDGLNIVLGATPSLGNSPHRRQEPGILRQFLALFSGSRNSSASLPQ